MDSIFGSITSGNQENLLTMAISTGKGINDLGEYDFCINNPGTAFKAKELTYATIQAFPYPLYIGVCLPLSCNSKNTQIIQDALSKLIISQGIPASALIVFPDSEPPTVQAINWIGFFAFGLLIAI